MFAYYGTSTQFDGFVNELVTVGLSAAYSYKQVAFLHPARINGNACYLAVGVAYDLYGLDNL